MFGLLLYLDGTTPEGSKSIKDRTGCYRIEPHEFPLIFAFYLRTGHEEKLIGCGYDHKAKIPSPYKARQKSK